MEKLKIENANTGVQIARASKEIMSKSDKIVIFTG
jgi:hypothetical protein